MYCDVLPHGGGGNEGSSEDNLSIKAFWADNTKLPKETLGSSILNNLEITEGVSPWRILFILGSACCLSANFFMADGTSLSPGGITNPLHLSAATALLQKLRFNAKPNTVITHNWVINTAVNLLIMTQKYGYHLLNAIGQMLNIL